MASTSTTVTPPRAAPSPWAGVWRQTLCWVAGIGMANAVAPAPAAAAPFGNAVLGPTPAPLTLEYFTALDCPACERFEREVLPRLLAESPAGTLRVVIRQLPTPEPAGADQARALLCLPKGADYLARRAELKRPPQRDDTLASGCRSDSVAQGVLDFNAAVFRAEGFPGTPAFVLTRHAGAAAIGRRSWAGRTTLRDWQTELSRLPASPAAPELR